MDLKKNMSTSDSNETTTFDGLNPLLELYLDELDTWQREVDNIRYMHHDIWKGTRLSPLIKQHRAGSRVERQTRILPTGTQTDMDYMFEVIGIQVESCGNLGHIYFRTTTDSPLMTSDYGIANAFGKVFIHRDMFSYALDLDYQQTFNKIFANALHFEEQEGAHLLIPQHFKHNVVSHCGLDYQKDELSSSASSPSIPGFGALNEYDGVPCLRLANWPRVALYWAERSSHDAGYAFDSLWKNYIIENVPLFIVPTGNPTSNDQNNEFRLSFSMVEIACFEKLIPQMRKMYGIVKYVFKKLFAEYNLLSSYHIKTLMLWKIDEISIESWQKMTVTDFIKNMMSDIQKAVCTKSLPHFFISKCNIFPIHKYTKQAVSFYEETFFNLPERLAKTLEILIRNDLKVNVLGRQIWQEEAKSDIRCLHERGSAAYIAGYLTRLLSVTTFSISENFAKNQSLGEESVEKTRTVLTEYETDNHISRIIPMINSAIASFPSTKYIRSRISPNILFLSLDKRSRICHNAFEAYRRGNIRLLKSLIAKAETLDKVSDEQSEIGISVTKYDKRLIDDFPILSVIKTLEDENQGHCPRFYLHPTLLIQHLRIQLRFRQLKRDMLELQEEINKLIAIVERLSIKEPYLGKLSFRYAGVYLLRGYKYLAENQKLQVSVLIPSEQFNQRNFATNFNLR